MCSIMKISRSGSLNTQYLKLCRFTCVILSLLVAVTGLAQTVFLDFNTIGQYTNNFNPWNDNGAGVDAASYSFTESATAGVGGSRGVNIFQSTDMTATY